MLIPANNILPKTHYGRLIAGGVLTNGLRFHVTDRVIRQGPLYPITALCILGQVDINLSRRNAKAIEVNCFLDHQNSFALNKPVQLSRGILQGHGSNTILFFKSPLLDEKTEFVRSGSLSLTEVKNPDIKTFAAEAWKIRLTPLQMYLYLSNFPSYDGVPYKAIKRVFDQFLPLMPSEKTMENSPVFDSISSDTDAIKALNKITLVKAMALYAELEADKAGGKYSELYGDPDAQMTRDRLFIFGTGKTPDSTARVPFTYNLITAIEDFRFLTESYEQPRTTTLFMISELWLLMNSLITMRIALNHHLARQGN